jgi:type IV pilus assembly protein PilC
MARFNWEAKSRTGTTLTGEMEAPNEAFVIGQLKRQQLSPVKVKQKAREFKLPSLGGGSVTPKDLAIFTRQFAVMIESGVSIVQCLDILGKQQENAAFKTVIVKVKEDVEGGATFAESLGKHPKVFDDLFVSLISAGEAGGILEQILQKLATYIEKNMRLQKKIKSAMTYPTTIVGVAVVVTLVLLLKVIPIFAKMFADFGGELPGPTKVVMALSEATKKYFFVFIAVGVGIYMGIKAYYKTAGGRMNIDRLLLKLPIVGTLIQRISVARFAGTLGTMVGAGVSILDAMDIVAKSAGNKVIETAVGTVRKEISEGRNIHEPLAEVKVFPLMVTQMVEVGEATGRMDAMLNKIAEFYEEEVDVAVDALTSMLEPLLMVFLGVVVGGLVIAMYLPIFKIAGSIGG